MNNFTPREGAQPIQRDLLAEYLQHCENANKEWEQAHAIGHQPNVVNSDLLAADCWNRMNLVTRIYHNL